MYLLFPLFERPKMLCAKIGCKLLSESGSEEEISKKSTDERQISISKAHLTELKENKLQHKFNTSSVKGYRVFFFQDVDH